MGMKSFNIDDFVVCNNVNFGKIQGFDGTKALVLHNEGRSNEYTKYYFLSVIRKATTEDIARYLNG